jgi:hypothetical protein
MNTNIPQVDAKKISIISIRLLNGNITSTEDAVKRNDTPLECETQFIAKNSVNKSRNEFITLLTIRLNAVDSNRVQVGITGEYTLEIRLRVENLPEYIVPSEGNVVVLHHSLTGTLMSIAYSTSRGIIFMRTLGSVLEGVILPVINPLEIPGVSSMQN